MSGSEEDRTVTDWRTESRFYRRRPGAGWLLAFLVIPALLALIGWGGLGRSSRSDELTMPSVNPSATLSVPATPSDTGTVGPEGGFPAWSIMRSGSGLTLAGELPDEETKSRWISVIKQVMPGINIDDKLTVTPGVRTPDPAALGGLFFAIAGIPDFDLELNGDVVTLSGTAPAEDVKAAAEEYAKASWPNVKVVNNIQVVAATPTVSATAPAPPAGPGAGDSCATLQADITDLLKTPINFVTDGFALAPESQRLLGQVADMVKACPNAKLAVVGYTDNTGNDGINVPLSGSRAKSVADALVSDGVSADRVDSRGAGSANPIASNDTPDGQAQNRRVEITVS
jgi:peptidoglycan-binding protein ArfA